MLACRVPGSVDEAAIVLEGEWREEWGRQGAEVFREKVTRALVARGVAALSRLSIASISALQTSQHPLPFLPNMSKSAHNMFPTISALVLESLQD